ncbi:MAG: DUF2087 domain-containing protein [Actinomycetota bacterium]|nr:DUF2087 domain-containing protein [Actinomycetota bacterium]
MPDEILRALADPERLALAGLLARRDRTAAELAADLDLRLDRVRRHLKRLSGAGIVLGLPDRRTYRLATEALRRAAQEVGPPREPGLALGAVGEEEEAVLRRYFVGGRLREIPAKRAKRLAVLSRLALEFDVGVRYPERDVDAVLRRFHPDHASLRRFLVDEGFLSRRGGEYWRTRRPGRRVNMGTSAIPRRAPTDAR